MEFHGFDHADVRVKNLAAVEALYDELMPALGLTRKKHLRVSGDDWQAAQPAAHNAVEYCEPLGTGRTPAFIGFIEDPGMQPVMTRIAFRLPPGTDLYAWAERLRAMGALRVEPCEAMDEYPAVFFEDAGGTKLELCARNPA